MFKDRFYTITPSPKCVGVWLEFAENLQFDNAVEFVVSYGNKAIVIVLRRG